ncbi:MAG: hypothetical protein M1825_004188 [Sarcosagium campestre]|nr:MAG: hypothetical protein M1825_004188 [Sarcosagium campestre]
MVKTQHDDIVRTLVNPHNVASVGKGCQYEIAHPTGYNISLLDHGHQRLSGQYQPSASIQDCEGATASATLLSDHWQPAISQLCHVRDPEDEGHRSSEESVQHLTERKVKLNTEEDAQSTLGKVSTQSSSLSKPAPVSEELQDKADVTKASVGAVVVAENVPIGFDQFDDLMDWQAGFLGRISIGSPKPPHTSIDSRDVSFQSASDLIRLQKSRSCYSLIIEPIPNPAPSLDVTEIETSKHLPHVDFSLGTACGWQSPRIGQYNDELELTNLASQYQPSVNSESKLHTSHLRHTAGRLFRNNQSEIFSTPKLSRRSSSIRSRDSPSLPSSPPVWADQSTSSFSSSSMKTASRSGSHSSCSPSTSLSLPLLPRSPLSVSDSPLSSPFAASPIERNDFNQNSSPIVNLLVYDDRVSPSFQLQTTPSREIRPYDPALTTPGGPTTYDFQQRRRASLHFQSRSQSRRQRSGSFDSDSISMCWDDYDEQENVSIDVELRRFSRRLRGARTGIVEANEEVTDSDTVSILDSTPEREIR